MKLVLITGMILPFFILSVGAENAFHPARGFVPDQSTAIAIARAVLIPIYGANRIKSEEPFMAIRKGDVWIVNGTLRCAPNCLGGTASVSLSASDGRILNLLHSK